jgi:leucyl/phenylalanyl-tRNA--protein transferase
VFDGERLVGGLYGVAVGAMFFAESMFSGASGGSKVALAALAHRLHAWGWPLIDAQVENDHLVSLGAVALPRAEFLARVARQVDAPEPAGAWTAPFRRSAGPPISHAEPGALPDSQRRARMRDFAGGPMPPRATDT